MTTPTHLTSEAVNRSVVDLVVIGTGPGGESLAAQAARAGLGVVAVEKHLVGGECPYYGCIPSKIMLRAAETLAEARRATAIAGDVEVAPDWRRVARRISTDATRGWSDNAATQRLTEAGATVVHGYARLAGPHHVDVIHPYARTSHYEARAGVVLNPGTRPLVPDIDGLSTTPYWTNRDAVQASLVPKSMIVLGGGAAAVELSQAFARFGAEVTIVETSSRLLHRDEPEASEVLRHSLEADGVDVRLSTHVVRVDYDGGFDLRLHDGSHLRAERLLLAAGRTSNTDDLGLETAGLAPESLRVGDDLRIGDNLWLIGDAAGHGAFTHTSMHQAELVYRQLVGAPGPTEVSAVVPHVTFTDPEVAGVGLTEHQARAKGTAVGSVRVDFGSRGFTHGAGAEGGFVKLVADQRRQVLIGATAVGPYAGEVLSMLTLAIHAELPIATLRSMVYAYPTFHRAVGAALGQLPGLADHAEPRAARPIRRPPQPKVEP